MGCGCTKKRNRDWKQEVTEDDSFAKAVAINQAIVDEQDRIKPMEQCLRCAYKHYSEALCLFTEYSYENENRMMICGNLRALVKHTYKEWKEVASLARECALLIEEARDSEAWDRMRTLADVLAKAYFEVFPEVKERLDSLKEASR